MTGKPRIGILGLGTMGGPMARRLASSGFAVTGYDPIAKSAERAKADGERQLVEADLGPVRYLATLLGAGDQDVLRWFILAVAMLLDPAAVLLLLAAASARRG